MPAVNHVMFTGPIWISGDQDNILPKGKLSCSCSILLEYEVSVLIV